jgi:hypothetical protein
MKTTTRVSLMVAIGRQLQAEYLPTAGGPLPKEIEELLAQLVALEDDKRESVGTRTDAARRSTTETAFLIEKV